jgi:hypothetical protein
MHAFRYSNYVSQLSPELSKHPLPLKLTWVELTQVIPFGSFGGESLLLCRLLQVLLVKHHLYLLHLPPSNTLPSHAQVCQHSRCGSDWWPLPASRRLSPMRSLRWSSVSAVRPATAQTFTLRDSEGGTHGGMQSSTGGTRGAPACVNNVVTPWMCTWVALLLLLPHPTHARKGGDER